MSLAKLMDIKFQISNLELEIKAISEDAISEAMEKAANGFNRVVFKDNRGKIVLQLRKRYLSENENSDLKKIADKVAEAKQARAQVVSHKLEQLNAEIERLTDELEKLNAERDNLLSCKQLKHLEAKYQEIKESTVTFHPSLSVFLNK